MFVLNFISGEGSRFYVKIKEQIQKPNHKVNVQLYGYQWSLL